MKIGIIQTEQGPNLAAFYGENWVSVPKALEALGEKPVNEMAQFIETYCDTVVELNQRIYALVEKGEAKSYTYTANLGEYSYKFMQVACLKNGTVYLFTYTSQPEQFDSHMGDVEKMLEHFKIK